ncbi:MAG TPA: hypothetical protein VFG10_18860 [Saprospiraceae bacterium]|nr:hypothetical protein [Saprospiraceae bacterium]
MQLSKPADKEIWINEKQSESVNDEHEIQVHKWGRGTGKTTLIGIKNYKRYLRLPRALFFLSSSTYHQILTKSLPPILKFFTAVGLEEYDWRQKRGHYVVCQKPPAHFEKPYSAPRKYDYTISLHNGFGVEMLSMDSPDGVRGGSYDGGDIDEAALVKKDVMQKVLFPSVRGNKDKFTDPLHGQKSLYTSAPWLSTGQYILEYEAKAKADPKTFFWSEATAYDNLELLGADWVESQRKIMDPRIFNIEILNQNLIRTDQMFYFKFDDVRHTYEPLITYSLGERGYMTDTFSDYDTRQILDISFDFGGWFNCALIFQAYNKQSQEYERCINAFHVKENMGIDELVDMICNHYKDHRMKYVRIWGEPRANDKTPNPITLFEQTQLRFIKNGWQTELKASKRSDSHETRRRYVNELFAENTSGPRIQFNQITCKDVIISIQMTGTTPEGKKDKSNEKDRTFSQEHATHYPDALDYYLMQKHFQVEYGMGCEVW